MTAFIGLRVCTDDLAQIDALAAKHGCSRAEAARNVLRLGLPLAQKGHSIDLQRMILLIEHMQASIDVIIHREHADAAEQLVTIAQERMAQFHA
ncbi:hypothetical protein [Croceicoccus marinus]|uniref:hypothetical protein n=1 Tax=Croceicoccus marinus TaxID=450378 RepID=UPI0012FAFC2A|nr:hypothetical protein [Croceicoccus marinus]